MRNGDVYVGRHRDRDEIRHAKYIKKVMGSNGKWRYIYDVGELKKDIRTKKSRLAVKIGAKKASMKAKLDYKTGKSFKNAASGYREQAKYNRQNAEGTKKVLSTDKKVRKSQKQFIKSQEEMAKLREKSAKEMDARYKKSIAGKTEAAKKSAKMKTRALKARMRKMVK